LFLIWVTFPKTFFKKQKKMSYTNSRTYHWLTQLAPNTTIKWADPSETDPGSDVLISPWLDIHCQWDATHTRIIFTVLCDLEDDEVESFEDFYLKYDKVNGWSAEFISDALEKRVEQFIGRDDIKFVNIPFSSL
jgi:hypothetical protein